MIGDISHFNFILTFLSYIIRDLSIAIKEISNSRLGIMIVLIIFEEEKD